MRYPKETLSDETKKEMEAIGDKHKHRTEEFKHPARKARSDKVEE